MSEPLHGVVVAHGTLAAAMIHAVEEISGVKGAFSAISNSGTDRHQLEEMIAGAVAGRPAVVFVDMPSGSCLFAAARRLAGTTDARVVTGVNLYMLLDFVFNRNVTPEEAARRAVDTGARAITTRG